MTRESHLETGAPAVPRERPNRPALGLEQPPHDVEAETHAAEPAPLATDLVEPLEDLGVLATRDAEAAVAHLRDDRGRPRRAPTR